MNRPPTFLCVEKQPFGVVDGKTVDLYVLTNNRGTVVKIMTYGAAITAIETADRNGQPGDIVLGFDDLAGYLDPRQPYIGALVGRVANRIAQGRFTLNGKTYQLAKNNGEHHLHGGVKGFDKVVWSAKEAASDKGPAVMFSYLSRNGEEGYPGNCGIEAVYTLTDDDALWIEYTATADQDTPLNITSHSYFNLSGPGTGDILNHELMLHADDYTPADDTLIPTGEIRGVAGTPMDFRRPTPIGAHLCELEGDPMGYDHNFVVGRGGAVLTAVATIREPTSGRTLEVSSTEPGVHLYTGNFLDGTITGKAGVIYEQHVGFCLETQHFPNSINQAKFPSIVLKAGHYYRSTTVLRFGSR